MPSTLVEVAIVIVAAVQCLTFLALLAVLLLLIKAFLYVRSHAPPIIERVEGTLETVGDAAGNVRDATGHVKEATVRVEGTTHFLTEQAVRPVIVVVGALIGIRRTVQALLGRWRGRRGLD